MILESLYVMATTATITNPWYVNPGFIALLGTLFGGAGLKVIEKWLGKSAEKRSERRDLNEEITNLVNRIDKLENEVTQWRTMYYHEQEQVALLRVLVIQNGGQLPETTVSKLNNPTETTG